MIDITNNIKDARSKGVLWSIDLFFDFIKQLKVNGYEISYWQNEENWANISFESILVGYL
jgi:hypothetical protein